MTFEVILHFIKNLLLYSTVEILKKIEALNLNKKYIEEKDDIEILR
jgi:hypothetical protein